MDNATVIGEVVGGGNGATLSIHSSSKVTFVAPFIVPEPASLFMLGIGLAGIGLVRKKIAVDQ